MSFVAVSGAVDGATNVELEELSMLSRDLAYMADFCLASINRVNRGAGMSEAGVHMKTQTTQFMEERYLFFTRMLEEVRVVRGAQASEVQMQIRRDVQGRFRRFLEEAPWEGLNEDNDAINDGVDNMDTQLSVLNANIPQASSTHLEMARRGELYGEKEARAPARHEQRHISRKDKAEAEAARSSSSSSAKAGGSSSSKRGERRTGVNERLVAAWEKEGKRGQCRFRRGWRG